MGAETEKRRSIQQHKRYFALVKSAYGQWPEQHAFQPKSEDHLRKWLQCKAGHRTVVEVEIPEVDEAALRVVKIAVAAAMAATKDFAWVVVQGGHISVVASRSINFDTLAHHEFDALSRTVEDIIRAETGIEPEALLREAAA